MSLDLATLQERYPHGSRWYGPDQTTLIVVGHRTDDGWPVFEVRADANERSYKYASWSGVLHQRIPDPPPSPITEPVTLHSFARHGNGPGYGMGGPFDESGGYPPITLLPQGQEPPVDAVHRGWWHT